MAGFAAIGLDEVQPLVLILYVVVDAAAARTGAGEFGFIGHVHHGVPVERGIELRGGLPVGRDGWLERDEFTGLSGDFRRIDKAVTASPDGVSGAREIGHD